MRNKIIFTLLSVVMIFVISNSGILNKELFLEDTGKPLPSKTAVSQLRFGVSEVYDFSKVPLRFIHNKGQVDGKAIFYSKASRYKLWVTKDGLVFDSARKVENGGKELLERDISKLVFIGANPDTMIVPVERTNYKVNYFKGNNPAQWKKEIPTSKAVLYRNIYRDIDLKIYGVEGQIEYDWIIKPGGDPGNIRFEYRNTKSTKIDWGGNLVIKTRFGKLVHKKPVSYQLKDGARVYVESGFKRFGKNEYGFVVGEYDKSKELVIDPLVVTLEYCSFLGGSGNDYYVSTGVSRDGQIHMTGYTYGSDFPLKNAYQDVKKSSNDTFITKFNRDGSDLVFSTFFGGTGSDYAQHMAISTNGDIYVQGFTDSTDLPALNVFSGNYDAFVVRFSADGEFLGCRYIGGIGNDRSKDIVLDNKGVVYLCGHTSSNDFPLVEPYQSFKTGGDAVFVCKLKSDLSQLIYSTYLGGQAHGESAEEIFVDDQGYFACVGQTSNRNFSLKNAWQTAYAGGQFDVIVFKFKPDGSDLVFSTYLGGNGTDYGHGVSIDETGAVYAGGDTGSTNFPMVSAYQDRNNGSFDIYVSKFSPDGSELLYSTYLGGSAYDYYGYMVTDREGNVYVAGSTVSFDFPTVNPVQAGKSGSLDTFFFLLDKNGLDLLYSTYLGGNSADHVGNIMLDGIGDVYIGGVTASPNFPVKNSYQPHAGGNDGFVAKFSLSKRLSVQSSTANNVPVTITPVDINGNGNGVTDFERYFRTDTLVTLTAPGSFNEKVFSRWLIDGVENNNRTIEVTMDNNRTVSAEYGEASEIILSRDEFLFGGTTTGTHTEDQSFYISNGGEESLNWSIGSNVHWLTATPQNGTNSGKVVVSVNSSGLSQGVYTGLLSVSAPGAVNSPQLVSVVLTVYNAGATGKPFGYFDTPLDGVTVSGSIPVTGWALDDIGVANVKIHRREGQQLISIGDAVFVEGARPDIELLYPSYPKCSQAGWGYMMLTNSLPGNGNGTFIIEAIATDLEGNQTTLGTKTIICDNKRAVKPFGTIDTPAQGETVAGKSYVNFGWVLTPQPNMIPFDGSTILVWVDGVNIGNPVYNIYRKDIANLFPGYANSNGALGYFYIDTTNYTDGIHTIQWSALDSAGNIDGIGSRYFNIYNGNVNKQSSKKTDYLNKGFDHKISLAEISSMDSEVTEVQIEELKRLEIRLTDKAGTKNRFVGYMVVGNELRPLPIGSTIDSESGFFYWSPGPGFIGTYRMLFVNTGDSSGENKKIIDVKIVPKYSAGNK